MKKAGTILLIVFCITIAASLWAQNKKGDKKSGDDKKTQQPAYSSFVPVYLGHSDIREGNITKNVFDSLLKQGLTSKDSSGHDYKVQEFRFNYGEVNLYEDSSGLNLMPITDYYVEICFGDTIPADISSSLYERTKPGDTVYFDNVTLLKQDSSAAYGKPMKFEIVK